MTAFIVAYFNPEDKALVRDALWDGTKFVLNEYPYRPLRTVTRWMPYPSLPPAREMRLRTENIYVTISIAQMFYYSQPRFSNFCSVRKDKMFLVLRAEDFRDFLHVRTFQRAAL